MKIGRPVEIFVVLAAIGAFSYVVYSHAMMKAVDAKEAVPGGLAENPAGVEVAPRPNSDQSVNDALTDFVTFNGTDDPTTLDAVGNSIMATTTGIGLLFARPSPTESSGIV